MRRGSIARPWLIVSSSLLLIAGLVAVLWQTSRSPQIAGQELVLLCAAGPSKAVQEIAADYEREYGVKIIVTPGNSGSLKGMLSKGLGHADLYLASDESFMRDAQREKLVAEVLPVVHQHAVVGVAKGNPRKIHSLDDLLKKDLRVVLPSAKATAVAESVARALRGTGHWQRLLDRQGVAGSRVSSVGMVTEAAQAVNIGAADATFVWDATARQYEIEAVELPELRSQTCEQAVVGVVSASSQSTAALQFARYLTARDRGEKVFQKYFYEPLADADVWEPRPQLVLMAGAMLKPGVDDVVQSFKAREGVDINTIYDGCGVLVSQMKTMRNAEGRPSDHFPDAYFSCDVSFMNKVQQWFEASTIISSNDMVLCVPHGNPNHVKSIEDLARPELRIGLGHRTKSALGELTEDLLKKLLLHDKVYDPARKTPVVEAAAADTLINDIRAKALDLLLVYRSNVVSCNREQKNPDEWLDIVEMNLKDAIAIQPFAVAKDTRHPYLMRRLLAAILAPESREHFRREGFHWLAEGTSP